MTSSNIHMAQWFHMAQWLINKLKQDENLYILVADGFETYFFQEAEKNMTVEQRKRIINIGISEQNAVGVAAGLALGGKIVYMVMFSAFLTSRAAEQIKLDIAYNNANVKLIGVHGGIVGPKIAGYSHWNLEDIATLNSYPHMKILVPAHSNSEMLTCLEYSYDNLGPIYIRLDNPGAPQYLPDYKVNIGKMTKVINTKNPKVAVFAIGNMVLYSYNVIKKLNNLGYKIVLYSVSAINPFDFKTLKDVINKNMSIITIEEHTKYGGLSSIIEHEIVKSRKALKFKSFNVKNKNFNKVFASEKAVNELIGINNLILDISDFLDKENKLINIIFNKRCYFDKKNRLCRSFNLFNIPMLKIILQENLRKSLYILLIKVFTK